MAGVHQRRREVSAVAGRAGAKRSADEWALGQFVLCSDILEELEPERVLYLAVRRTTYEALFEEGRIGEVLLQKGRLGQAY